MTARHIPRKRFGQHFLHDRRVIERLVTSIAPEPNQPMVEIGPGQGALTVPLLETGVRLTVVELDRDLIQQLISLQSRYPDLTVLHQDALELELASITGDPVAIVGNLPYNISSPLLFHLFEQNRLIESMTFMLQKEVVDRLCAETGSSDYGRLSVMTRFYCEVEKLFDVEPMAFTPPPKVMSSVVRLLPRPRETDIDPDLFATVVKQAFSQRRKMLRNNLSRWLGPDDYGDVDFEPSQRAQELSLAQFKLLTSVVDKFVSKK